MKRWRVESTVRIHKEARPVHALAIAGDDVQVAALVERTLYVGLLGPSGFPAPLLPTGVTTDTSTEELGAEIRRVWETLGSRELSTAHHLQWTPDGTALWVAGEQAVVLYDVAGAVVRSLPRRARVGVIKVSPGGGLILGIGSHIVGADSETGRIRWKLSGHGEAASETVADSDMRGRSVTYSLHVNAVDVASDGRVLSGSDDGTVRLWRYMGLQDATVFDAGGPVFDACFLDERRAIVASRLGPVFALELGTKERLWSEGKDDLYRRMRAFALSKDRRLVAVARAGTEALLLDTSTGEPLAVAPLPEGAQGVASLCFTRDSSRLLLGTDDGCVALYREAPAG